MTSQMMTAQSAAVQKSVTNSEIVSACHPVIELVVVN
jgi:hypothetical protein